MWDITCQRCKKYTSTNLVLVQEHLMDNHGYTQADFQDRFANTRAHLGGESYEFSINNQPIMVAVPVVERCKHCGDRCGDTECYCGPDCRVHGC